MKNNFNLYTDNRSTTPFTSSEEAWFWYCFCENMPREKTTGNNTQIIRPCETSDIFLSVKRLIQEGRITREHLDILSKYGFEQMPPHKNFGDSSRICKLWSEALNFLENLLRKKGIVY